MKKSFFSLLCILTMSSAMASFEKEVPSAMSFKEGETGYVSSKAVVSPKLAVKPMKVTGFSGSYLTKLNKAFVVLERVVNSEQFKDRIINFKNKSGARGFASNKGLTNEQIFAQIMEGRETLQPNTPNEMNYYVNLYYKRWTSVVGYTTPNTNTININSKFFGAYEPNEVAGNLAHEWSHKIGFDHTSAAQHDSVPYAVGYIVEELGRNYLKNEAALTASKELP